MKSRFPLLQNLLISHRSLAALLPLSLIVLLGMAISAPDVSRTVANAKKEEPPALKALLVTGGCCHDYNRQKVIIPGGVSQRAKVDWTIVHEGGTSRNHKVSIYSEKDWTAGYDVIVHNECFGGVKDDAFVEALAKAHETTPAVVLHCSMHSYRAAPKGAEEWRRFLGVTSRNHGRHAPIKMKNLKPDHPVMKGFPAEWTTPKGELYRIEKVWDTATPLAEGTSGPNENHICVWVNQYGEKKSRVFGTTIGHHNETMLEPTYLDLVTRGLLWAAGKLGDGGKPLPGYGAKN